MPQNCCAGRWKPMIPTIVEWGGWSMNFPHLPAILDENSWNQQGDDPWLTHPRAFIAFIAFIGKAMTSKRREVRALGESKKELRPGPVHPQKDSCLQKDRSNANKTRVNDIELLVGGFNQPLWKMMEWKPVGMMTFPIYGKIIQMFQTTNQITM